MNKTQNYILLRDDFTESNPTMTITNDAENVVEYLYEHGLTSGETDIYYIGTDNEVTELIHNGDGKFTGYRFAASSEQEFYEKIK